MSFFLKNTKATGNKGEDIACEYLRRNGFRIRARNVAKRVGEIDVVAQKGNTLHMVEVKTVQCVRFRSERGKEDVYDPSVNLHQAKIRRVVRTGEWYVAQTNWEGEWQVDAVLVWIRKEDQAVKVEYIPQIV